MRIRTVATSYNPTDAAIIVDKAMLPISGWSRAYSGPSNKGMEDSVLEEGPEVEEGEEDSLAGNAHESHGGEEESSTHRASAVVSPSSKVQADDESPKLAVDDVFQILTYMTQQRNILLQEQGNLGINICPF